MPPIVGQSLESWDVGKLTRWLNDRMERFPPSSFESIKADTLVVTSLLQVEDSMQFTKNADFRKFGTAGNPAFTNSWVNFGSGNQVAGYWKDPLGFIHLRGTVKSGTINASIATLPPGSRPDTIETFAVDSNNAHGRVDVHPDGTIVPAVGSNVYLSLGGITFFAKKTT